MAGTTQAQKNDVVAANTPNSSAKLPTAVQNKAVELPAAIDTTKANGKLVMPDTAVKNSSLTAESMHKAAFESALQIPDGYDRGKALSDLAIDRALADDFAAAKDIALEIRHPSFRCATQLGIARAMRFSEIDGNLSETVETALNSALALDKSNNLRDTWISTAIGEQIAIGSIADAEKNVKQIGSPGLRDITLNQLAEAHANKNNYEVAEQVASSMQSRLNRVNCLIGIAKIMAASNADPLEMLKSAEFSSNQAFEPQRSEARSGLVSVLIELERIDYAGEIAAGMEVPGLRSTCQTNIAVKIAKTGGDPAEMFANAEASALAMKDNSAALAYLGISLTTAGEYDKAKTVIEKISDPTIRSAALYALSKHWDKNNK